MPEAQPFLEGHHLGHNRLRAASLVPCYRLVPPTALLGIAGGPVALVSGAVAFISGQVTLVGEVVALVSSLLSLVGEVVALVGGPLPGVGVVLGPVQRRRP